jgi:cytoskeletal protein CcmA (bactofilin family)
MDSKPPEPLATGSEDDSLEGPSTETDSAASPLKTTETTDSAPPDLPTPSKKPNGLARLAKRVNIYLMFFIMIVLAAGIIVVAAYVDSKNNGGPSTVSSQNLSSGTLQQLADNDTTVGDSSQVLNVKSSTVFAGKVLVRQDLEVAGNLQIGGTLGLNNLAVTGTAQFGQVQINKNLAVAGTTSLQGAVTIAKSLQVNGGGTFSGPLSAPQITTGSLQLSGDLALTHHITAGGATPGRTNGGALGSGGTSSVSGSDTSGSITINTGGGPAAGCFLTVTFTAKYAATPHVILTPVGAAAGGLSYYVNRTSSSFSVCDAAAPPAGASFGFDYFVVD